MMTNPNPRRCQHCGGAVAVLSGLEQVEIGGATIQLPPELEGWDCLDCHQRTIAPKTYDYICSVLVQELALLQEELAKQKQPRQPWRLYEPDPDGF